MDTPRNRKVGLPVAAAMLLLLAGAARPQGTPAFSPGGLPPSWPHGGPGCAGVPDFYVHRYNEDLYILRQSGCSNYEKPFLY